MKAITETAAEKATLCGSCFREVTLVKRAETERGVERSLGHALVVEEHTVAVYNYYCSGSGRPPFEPRVIPPTL
jgi:hypothetical protein